ncbi:MAG: SH3 domain-containing protein, partial [Anaerolineae bacterium]|nr:SH3 domain-containing protein [Anaerolineae bacterium]
TSFVRLGIATFGQSFPIIGRTAQGNWLQIILPDGRAAWVSAGLVQISPSDVAIPVATDIPGTPSSTPTPGS